MKTYFLNLNSVSDSDFKKWFNEADDKRKETILCLKNKNKQKSRIAADRLRRTAIAEFCNISPAEISFHQNSYGKPYATGLPVFFSISHSGDMVVCAVSEKEIGIDIEKIRPVNLRAAEKFATEKELAYIKNNENGFFDIWTLKEAFFKCIGTGLGADIKKVSFEIDKQSIVCSENGFACSFVKTAEEYVCSVCEKVR